MERAVNIAICDDEKAERDYTINIIRRQYGPLHGVLPFESGQALVDYYREGRLPLDIILLDIYMPELNGIDAAKLVRARDEQVLIILLTSSKEHYLRGYEVHAYQYLAKPVPPGMLKEVLDKAIDRVRREEETILVKESRQYRRLQPSRIIYADVNDNYVVFHMFSGETVSIIGTMKAYMELLSPHGFVLIHAGCAVNLKYVTMLDATRRAALLHNGEELQIARGKMTGVSDAFFLYSRGARL